MIGCSSWHFVLISILVNKIECATLFTHRQVVGNVPNMVKIFLFWMNCPVCIKVWLELLWWPFMLSKLLQRRQMLLHGCYMLTRCVIADYGVRRTAYPCTERVLCGLRWTSRVPKWTNAQSESVCSTSNLGLVNGVNTLHHLRHLWFPWYFLLNILNYTLPFRNVGFVRFSFF